MKSLRATALLAVAALGTTLVAVAGAGSASADTVICETYGSTTIQGRYVVMNNNWGDSTQQCITVSSTGFSVTTASHNKATNGAPGAYPAVYYGCHYANCSPGTILPALATSVSNIQTSVSMSYPSSGTFDAAYDIWYDPTARKDGQNTGAEIMVWLNHAGSIQPVGSKVATASIAGATWDVWEGNSGWNVVSYVRQSTTGSASFAPASFFNDAVSRGYAQNSWYLTSIQAGFEPWIGGTGLAVNSFSVTTDGTPVTSTTTTTRSTTTTTTTTRSTTSSTSSTTRSTTTTTGGGGTKGCTAAYSVTGQWTGGFQGNVTVTAGSAAISGWTVTWTFANGQTINQSWGATVTSSGSSVTAKNLSYNGSLGAGANTSFGFIGNWNGSNATPSVSCTAS